jgi:hypothetical protein
MKNQQDLNHGSNTQGNSTSDRAFTNQKAAKKKAASATAAGSAAIKHPTGITTASTKITSNFKAKCEKCVVIAADLSHFLQ